LRRNVWVRNTEFALLHPATLVMAPLATFAGLGMAFALVLKTSTGRSSQCFCRSDAAFGKKLKENFAALGILGLKKRFLHGGNEYRFLLIPEQLQQCQNTTTIH